MDSDVHVGFELLDTLRAEISPILRSLSNSLLQLILKWNKCFVLSLHSSQLSMASVYHWDQRQKMGL